MLCWDEYEEILQDVREPMSVQRSFAVLYILRLWEFVPQISPPFYPGV